MISPEQLAERNILFDKIWSENEVLVPGPSFQIKLNIDNESLKAEINDDKTILTQNSWPNSVAHIFCKNHKDYIAAKFNGELYDMNQKITSDGELEFLTFDNADGKKVFWHTTAHLLGMCCEKIYGSHLVGVSVGPDGFYFDVDSDIKITFDHINKILSTAKSYIKSNKAFNRLSVSKENLLSLFKYNPLKFSQIDDKKIDIDNNIVCRCGELVDICLHQENIPHLVNVGSIKKIKITNLSSTYWLGNPNNKLLTRVHGISFSNKKQEDQWIKEKELIAARDHRVIGKNQQLFFFDEYSPGSCFFYPHGTIIYNKLVDFIKKQYRHRGFSEVITPNIYDTELWKKSGHWEHYQDNMFKISTGNKSGHSENLFAMKPMNCPGHCIMFSSLLRSYRDLPIRYADFGVLHRNELHGALTGLTRVRRFEQDDAHIFCEENQVESEINSCLEFMKYVYGTFGFSFTLALSTRPESSVGSDDMWQIAEAQLKKALDNSGFEWTINLGDGAFYGPKIDITIEDAIGRKHQCATIQLDFNLPSTERFDLAYQKPDGSLGRPVIIHRAILGSVERMMAILIENYAGRWPFWLSPRQISIIPVDKKFNTYAKKVYEIYHNKDFCVEIDLSSDKLAKKIRNAQVQQFNFIFVVGSNEESMDTVNVRTREGDVLGTFKHVDVITKLIMLDESKTIDNTFK